MKGVGTVGRERTEREREREEREREGNRERERGEERYGREREREVTPGDSGVACLHLWLAIMQTEAVGVRPGDPWAAQRLTRQTTSQLIGQQ